MLLWKFSLLHAHLATFTCEEFIHYSYYIFGRNVFVWAIYPSSGVETPKTRMVKRNWHDSDYCVYHDLTDKCGRRLSPYPSHRIYTHFLPNMIKHILLHQCLLSLSNSRRITFIVWVIFLFVCTWPSDTVTTHHITYIMHFVFLVSKINDKQKLKAYARNFVTHLGRLFYLFWDVG